MRGNDKEGYFWSVVYVFEPSFPFIVESLSCLLCGKDPVWMGTREGELNIDETYILT